MKLNNIIHKLIWDYNITAADFTGYLNGTIENGWFNRDWAIARCINNLNYYELMEIVHLSDIKECWERIKNKIRVKEIRDGLEFVLQQNSISIDG